MFRFTLLLITTCFLSFGTVTDAKAFDLGLGLFKRKQKPDTGAKAKALATTLISDTEEQKRIAAAEELRGLDPRTNPEILPALLSALQKDPVPAVRSAAAETIGKLKPVSQQAGIVLETVSQSDPDQGVRDAIKSALWQYHLNGYKPSTAAPTFTNQSPEPPLAGRTTMSGTTTGRTVTPPDSGFRPITNTVGKSLNLQQTAEPPLAKPTNAPISLIPPKPPAPPAPVPVAKITSVPPKPTLPQVTLPTVPTPMPSTPPSNQPPTVPTIPSGIPEVRVPAPPTESAEAQK